MDGSIINASGYFETAHLEPPVFIPPITFCCATSNAVRLLSWKSTSPGGLSAGFYWAPSHSHTHTHTLFRARYHYQRQPKGGCAGASVRSTSVLEEGGRLTQKTPGTLE